MQERLLDLLESTSKSIDVSADSFSFIPLRGLQKNLEFVSLNDQDKKVRFLSFFLGALIEDAFYNFSGELLDNEEVEKKKRELFVYIVSSLSELSKTIKNKNDKREFQILQLLVDNYINKINEINSIYLQTSEGIKK